MGRTTKWRYGLCLAAASAIAISACSSGGSGGKSGGSGGGSTHEITIGEIGEFSGRGSVYGEPVSDGFALGLQEAKDSGYLGEVHASISVTKTDDASDTTLAATQWSKAMQAKRSIVISSALSNIEAVLSPLANQAKVPYLAVGSGGGGSDSSDYAFRMLDIPGPTKTLGAYVGKTAGARVGVIEATDTPVFAQVDDATEAGMKAAGAPGFVDVEKVLTTTTDYSSVLANLRQKNLTAVLLSVPAASGGNILSQMAKAGGFEKVLKVGTVAWIPSLVSNIAGPANSAGTVFVLPWAATSSDRDKAFVTAYQSAYKKDPDQFSAMGHDAGWLVAVAVHNAIQKTGGTSGKAIRDALATAPQDPVYKQHTVISGLAFTPPTEIPEYAGVLVKLDSAGKVVPIETTS